MKKMLFVLLIFTLTISLTVIGCSKKRSVPLSPEIPAVTNTPAITFTPTYTFTVTDTATVGNTATFTDTATSTYTATETDTINPFADTATETETFTVTNTETETETFTITNTETETVTVTETPDTSLPYGWIDDCEDIYGPNQNDFHIDGSALNVGGYWITYDDNATTNDGTSYVWPMSDTWATRMGVTPETFQMSAPGHNSSYAARITGYATGCEGGAGSWWLDTTCSLAGITTYWPIDEDHAFRFGFIGMGIQLTPTAGEGATGGEQTVDGNITDDPNDCQEVDISTFSAITFWVKGDGLQWRMKIPYTNQLNCDGYGGTIAERKACNYAEANDIGHSWTPTDGVWEQKTINLDATDMTHEGWAFTCSSPGGLCDLAEYLAHVKQIQFQTFGDPAAANRYPNTRELWIDDIQLVP